MGRTWNASRQLWFNDTVPGLKVDCWYNLQKFKSACAPDPPTPKQLTVAELRTKLEALGQPISGKKADLVARLAAASTSTEASKGDLPLRLSKV